MRTLGPSSAALAQSSWSLLLMALVTGPFLGRFASEGGTTCLNKNKEDHDYDDDDDNM